MPNPQRVFGRFKQARHPAAVQFRRIFIIEDREAQAIEPRQSAISAHPQITVTRLHHGSDFILGQTVLYLPDAGEIICHIGGIGRPHRKRESTAATNQARSDSDYQWDLMHAASLSRTPNGIKPLPVSTYHSFLRHDFFIFAVTLPSDSQS